MSTVLSVFSGGITPRVCRRASSTFPPDEVAKNMSPKALLAYAAVTLAAPVTSPKPVGCCLRERAGVNVFAGNVLQDAGDSVFDQHPAGLSLHIVLTPKDTLATTGWCGVRRWSDAPRITTGNGWMVVTGTRDMGIFPNGHGTCIVVVIIINSLLGIKTPDLARHSPAKVGCACGDSPLRHGRRDSTSRLVPDVPYVGQLLQSPRCMRARGWDFGHLEWSARAGTIACRMTTGSPCNRDRRIRHAVRTPAVINMSAVRQSRDHGVRIQARARTDHRNC
ncbi:hypothetical protein EDB19DRAFT_638473 [Suillus lakei]|nr:hypothetical protein EDB19DRAFT_638473 [Suillus lakei]